MTACGLDFGTSNTTLGLAADDGPVLVALEGADVTLPSAVFYGRAGAVRIGREAIAAYVAGEQGRLMRALKSVLGSALVDETTLVGRERVRFRDVIRRFLGAVKARAEAAADRPIEAVVHGRPVHFVDGDPAADRRAEEALAAIAAEVGFRYVSFEFEPIAASLDYERSVAREEIALIADIGGGTSDFSIVRLSPERRRREDRADDILANDGVRIGGTDFDRDLSLGVVMPLLGYRSMMKRPGLAVPSVWYHDLATWSAINRLYEPRVARALFELERDAAEPRRIARLRRAVEDERGHALAMDVEAAKIATALDGAARIDLSALEAGLAAPVDHDALVAETAGLAERIAARVTGCLAMAGLAAGDIDALFLTGGSTRLSHVRGAITAALPDARVVEGDTFGAVGLGLAVAAGRRYGAAMAPR